MSTFIAAHLLHISKTKYMLVALGDGVAQLVERRTLDPKTRGSNPACVRSPQEKCVSFSESKMLC